MGRKTKLIKKLAKLSLEQGSYQYTTRSGIDVYGPSRYDVNAVVSLVDEAKQILKRTS
jgi:hypothetical protein